MASVKEHYDNLLAGVYTWLAGDFSEVKNRNGAFFKNNRIAPRGSGTAIDLGSGPGFQSIALAEIGFSVTAIDQNEQLLSELSQYARGLNVLAVHDDLMNFQSHCRGHVELIVCMTDTLTHLTSGAMVQQLLDRAFASLEPGGRLVLSLRDYSRELTGLDRFIPIKSDENTVFTCFLEYEAETVKVHDLVYRKTERKWTFTKSFYRKIRLSRPWLEEQLIGIGFNIEHSSIADGLVTLICSKNRSFTSDNRAVEKIARNF